MTNLKTETFALPAFWASALVNGDTSGLTDEDETAMNTWLEAEPQLANCLGCSDEAQFTKVHDAYGLVLACDCLEFTFALKDQTGGKS